MIAHQLFWPYLLASLICIASPGPDSMSVLSIGLARGRREAHTHRGVASLEQFQAIVEGPGGFVFTGWCGDETCEGRVKEETKATIRVLPDDEFRSAEPADRCLCGAPSIGEVVRARAY